MSSDQMWSLLRGVVVTPFRGESSSEGGAAYYECRLCGTSVDTEEAECPYCEDSVVVGYDFG